MNESSIVKLDELLGRSTEQMLEVFDCPVVPTASHEQIESAYAATIGYTAGKARGALAIAAPTDLLVRTLPKGVLADETALEAILLDWTGELSNQLLGRVKTKLMPHGLDIQLSIPVVVAAKLLSYIGSSSSVQRKLDFESNGDPLRIMFSMSECDHVELDPSLVDEEPIEDSSDVELF